MEQANTAERKINNVSGALGTVMMSQGPNVPETWTPQTVVKHQFTPVNCGTAAPVAWNGYCVVLLGDAVTNHGECHNKVPDDFVSAISLKFLWVCPAAAGNMSWEVTLRHGAAGELYNQHSSAPGRGTTATAGANLFNLQEEPIGTLAIANLALGDYYSTRIERTGGHPEDTLNADVRYFGMELEYNAKLILAW